ncbi:hypothetical protein MUK42_34977 [Musa troglodytarum]|uniref:Argonaut glycine-rich domain-containing protein n=1 Tax=Musa troglodytarum TaxID=320322 RepID=A0A9E7GQ95_9LILI|nr:hypothetical protein MUK42_34977 [Musa troglodytarum]
MLPLDFPTQAPLQATQTTPWQASSSWQPEISAIEFVEKFEQHSVQGEASCSQIMQPVVSIMPEVTSHSVNHAVMQKLVKLHRESYLGGCLPVYDGNHSHLLLKSFKSPLMTRMMVQPWKGFLLDQLKCLFVIL